MGTQHFHGEIRISTFLLRKMPYPELGFLLAAYTVTLIIGNDGVEIGTDVADTQEVSYYEVALGTDRRFPNTRDNVVPFTNVGKNKTVTFYNLDLLQGTAMYYFSVRAYSATYSTALATSNGFYVSGVAGVTG